jgi:hypothetical protein
VPAAATYSASPSAFCPPPTWAQPPYYSYQSEPSLSYSFQVRHTPYTPPILRIAGAGGGGGAMDYDCSSSNTVYPQAELAR